METQLYFTKFTFPLAAHEPYIGTTLKKMTLSLIFFSDVLSVIMLDVVSLCAIMLNVMVKSFVMLSVVMLIVFILDIFKACGYDKCLYAECRGALKLSLIRFVPSFLGGRGGRKGGETSPFVSQLTDSQP